MFHDYMTINPSIEIYLIDLEGTILSFSADPGVVKRKRVSLGPVRAFLSGDDAYPVLGDDPRSHDGHKAFSVTPVPSDESRKAIFTWCCWENVSTPSRRCCTRASSRATADWR